MSLENLFLAAVVGITGLFGVYKHSSAAPAEIQTTNGKLSPQQVKILADSLIRKYGFNVSANLATAIAIIESGDVNYPANGCAVNAYRAEPQINDASAGLMQTLSSTAQWLAKDMNYKAMGDGNNNSLYNPTTSMYFGLAYLDYLSRFNGKARSEAWIVQSYNAGPNNSSTSYYTKYQKALAWVQKYGG